LSLAIAAGKPQFVGGKVMVGKCSSGRALPARRLRVVRGPVCLGLCADSKYFVEEAVDILGGGPPCP
jgi:hypothetical protein